MRSDGREFHEEGPETANARGPSVAVRHRGMQSSPAAADRSFDLPGMVATGTQCYIALNAVILR